MTAKTKAFRAGAGVAGAALAISVWLPSPSAPSRPFVSVQSASLALSLDTFAARPVFDPSRRPDPFVATAAAAAKLAPAAFEALYAVRGVVSGQGGAVVILERLAAQQMLRLTIGQSLEGRKFVAVESDAIVFETKTGRISLPRPRRAGA